ncbi:hypothetical protein [Sporolactobacillus nakayamae]|uniref:Phage-related protein n=1 Tax=Sporolactobacillus nakayamae TaxID=269670 RepID=A0A1I2P125_9BACL|nr:hypothetical protein [Sporolactobacillus nakayamae]SFG09905.1 hypothetical protein SAMN02982927_00666 [Sporolactobacillus nakayamae]
MIKEALEYLVNLGNTRVEQVGDQQFSTQPLYLVKEPTPEEIKVQSLSGLADYIISNFDEFVTGSGRLMVHVIDPVTVVAFSQLNFDQKRSRFIRAEANLPSFSFDRFYGTEEFNVKLQSAFLKSLDRDVLLQVVGNLQEENVANTGDDGVTQTVVVKTGVATLNKAEVPNPVNLAPFRTFTEVDQPFSDFIFRMRTGPTCALFEADGGAWELQAMKNIKEFLAGTLDELIEQDKVIIIA